MNQTETYLTIGQVMERGNVSRPTVMRAIAADELSAKRIGRGRGTWRVSEASFRAWMGAEAEPEAPPSDE
ncbi:MAG: helix-turn-helix domain-containing protein [Bradyrhizobium sp.]|uniref:helix-turn-helix domain-containing protein n=1 Tax=Bradyrhizobium sp. TaxID=376 RepID=UPI003D1023E6